jgi:hypothetical protein
MSSKRIITLISVCALVGFLCAGLKRGWIIVQLPSRIQVTAEATADEKRCTLWFFGPQGLRSETTSCVWPHDTALAVEHLVNAWLGVIVEEGILTTPLQATVLMSTDKTAYVSFDHSPFNREDSLRTQWLFVEGLLKTIREATPEVHQVQLLVNHKQLHSRHLDFEHSWPVNGFLE